MRVGDLTKPTLAVDETIELRAWCLVKALEFWSDSSSQNNADTIVDTAQTFENYITKEEEE